MLQNFTLMGLYQSQDHIFIGLFDSGVNLIEKEESRFNHEIIYQQGKVALLQCDMNCEYISLGQKPLYDFNT